MKDTKQHENKAAGKIFGTSVHRVEGENKAEDLDYLAVEDPLEIALEYGPEEARINKSIAVTMRTPGHDKVLALGFLFSEGIISGRSDVESVKTTVEVSGEKTNRVLVGLKPGVRFDEEQLNRNFFMSSSCGVCGKASIDAVRMSAFPGLNPGFPKFESSFFHQLPSILLDQQAVFEHTGGLHAAALFDKKGHLVLVREDVGRHNAMDKLIGEAMEALKLPLHNFVILVSGRVSFELVQKALMAGVPVIAAVGAPSSLAVQLSNRFGMTLIGFIRGGRYNIYSGHERVS